MLLTLLALQACVYIDQSTLDARLDLDGDGIPYPTDCAPDDAAVFPGAPEICDGIDQDCDGEVDNDSTDAPIWYTDSDGDGHGDLGAPIVACDQPANTVSVGDDCNDEDAAFYPGAPETDCADSHDYNCDGSAGGVDADGDGFTSCEDCDDAAPDVNPNATEVCNGVDDDCDSVDDNDAVDALTWYADADADTYGNAASSTLACDAPALFVADDTDCNDASAAVHPDAEETCNAIDDNCDGFTDNDATDAALWYTDADSDGYGDGAGTASCAAPAGTSAYPGDCDDASARYHPGADESDCTDASDYNCDGATGAVDLDGDGYVACEECDDANASVHPEATELCNTIDDNCDGTVDEDSAVDAVAWYADTDGDGYGDAANTTLACNRPSGHLADDTDCDDSNTSIHPGAVEACDALDTDEDCDDVADEAGASGESTWYQDVDEDGYGSTVSVSACDQPATYVSVTADCDDSDPDYNPGALELDCADPADYNCDGHTGYADLDGDGWAACEECDDGNAAVSPNGIEICNGIDDDCSGVIDDDASDASVWFEDLDGDGFGSDVQESACSASLGYVANAGDCDDTTGAVNPAATERCDERDTDENCDGLADDVSATGQSAWYVDADVDGFGAGASTLACNAPAGQVSDSTDCDDAAWATNPGAVEIVGDSVDEDCDGVESCYEDDDDDGYLDSAGDTRVSADVDCVDVNEGTNTDLTSDCDDGLSSMYPGAPEACNGVDDNCDGSADEGVPTYTFYRDSDGDSYGDATVSITGCAATAGYVSDDTDCDDADGAVHPAAAEVCENGIDDDCDGGAGACGPGDRLLLDADAQFSGDSAWAMAGWTVSAAGDVNHDTFGDMLIGAPYYDSYAGAAFLVLGSATPTSSPLSGTVTFTGESANDYAGLAISAAGDVNHDGFGDLLVGAGWDDAGGADAGAAYLILGSGTPADIGLGAADAKFIGEVGGDYAGWSVSTAGDVNGDEFGDLVIGAGNSNDGGEDAGAAYVILGSATPGDVDLGSANAEYIGEAFDYAGRAVSTAGDIDGDGLGDIMVGAEYDDDGGLDAGAAYLILGSGSPGDASLAVAGVKYTGEAAGDQAGNSLAGGGDVDRDGYDDVLVSASRHGSSGAVYLVLGAVTPASSSLSTAARYSGDASCLNTGTSVSTGGDVDADGYDDILIGCDFGSGNPGMSYLVLGSSSPASTSLSGADAQYTGQAGDEAGRAVAFSGDVDGNGISDILIGAPSNADAAASGGAAYLLLGGGL